MFVETRHDAREFFFQVRRKMHDGTAMEPLEQLVSEIINHHPEYHAVLDDPARALNHDFGDDPSAANPFLHMGLHIALVEQLQTDRPAGVRAVYQRLVAASDGAAHEVEHRMMAILAEELHGAAYEGRTPDIQRYLQRLETVSV